MRQLIFILLIFSIGIPPAFSADLPITAYKGDAAKPLVFYISGDGGWNAFSTSFMRGLNKEGYSVVGLNARSYFWSRKKPQQAANEISTVLNQYRKDWNCKNLVIIGYSFGADVAPFIQTHLPKNLSDLVSHTVLMSPSKKTDFEVHVLGMIGWSSSNGESVPDEINKLVTPLTLVFGSDENDFPLKKLTVKNSKTIRLAGGHHYDGNVDELIRQVGERIK